MEVAHRIDEVRSMLAGLSGHAVGLVPTMGNLHEGHLELVGACRRQSDVRVASIFVNPTQFGPNEDFANYPRTLDDDLARLDEGQVDVVFNPGVEEMYPTGHQDVTVTVPDLANTLCGASRPGHFDGVATVVAKLFNIVQPKYAFFGEKDWQQLTVIRAMVRQLDMPIDVVGVPTVRAESGLALSSRNHYLSDAERDQAALLNATLANIKQSIEARRRRDAFGNQQYRELEDAAVTALTDGGFDVDYVAVRDAHRLCEPDAASTDLRILAAARLGGARLIDNVGVPR